MPFDGLICCRILCKKATFLLTAYMFNEKIINIIQSLLDLFI